MALVQTNEIESFEDISESVWCDMAHTYLCEDCGGILHIDEYGCICPPCNQKAVK